MTTSQNPDFKILIAGRRPSEMTLAEHHNHIREIHGKLVLDLIQTNPDHAPRRYAQNRVLDGTWRTGGNAGDPFALGRDFVTQVWFDNPAQAMDALSHPLYKEKLQPDEDNFVDQVSIVKLPVREHFVVESSLKRSNVKLFVFFSKLSYVSSAEFVTAWQQRGKELAASSSATVIQQYVQNQVMAKPGDTPWADGVDEFWVDDLASARVLAADVQSMMTNRLTEGQWIAPQTVFYLIAEESVLFAGAGAITLGQE